jgi:hypothetical protein
MAKLVNMKRPPRSEDETEKALAAPSESRGPEYGWGLNLRLENFELDKLGIKKLPSVDDEVTITARARISSVNVSKMQGNPDDRSVGIQVTDLAIDGVGAKDT